MKHQFYNVLILEQRIRNQKHFLGWFNNYNSLDTTLCQFFIILLVSEGKNEFYRTSVKKLPYNNITGFCS